MTTRASRRDRDAPTHVSWLRLWLGMPAASLIFAAIAALILFAHSSTTYADATDSGVAWIAFFPLFVFACCGGVVAAALVTAGAFAALRPRSRRTGEHPPTRTQYRPVVLMAAVVQGVATSAGLAIASALAPLGTSSPPRLIAVLSAVAALLGWAYFTMVVLDD